MVAVLEEPVGAKFTRATGRYGREPIKQVIEEHFSFREGQLVSYAEMWPCSES
jgi:hypothetical protein